MKLNIVVFLFAFAAFAQYPELPEIRSLRKSMPREFREASADAARYIANDVTSANVEDFNRFADKWLSDEDPLGFVALESQLLARKDQYESFFLGNPIVAYAIRKKPAYGRLFLMRLLKTEAFPKREKAVFLLEIDRMKYATYWMPKLLWLSLLRQFILDPTTCSEMGELIPHCQAFVNSKTGKIRRKIRIERRRRIIRCWEVAYNVLPRSIEGVDVDFKNMTPKQLKPLLEKVAAELDKEIADYRKKEAAWLAALNYHAAGLTAAQLEKRLDKWASVKPRGRALYLDDLQKLIFFLCREVQAVERKGDPARQAAVDVLVNRIVALFARADVVVKKPIAEQKRWLGEIKLWLREPLAKLGRSGSTPLIGIEMNGFWKWLEGLDPVKVAKKK